MRKLILKTMTTIDNVFTTISALFLLLATILAVLNAILRFANLGGITWAEELCTILMILLVYLAQPQLEFGKRQLAISVLQNMLKTDKSRQVLNIIQGVITIVITGVVLYYCFVVFGSAAKYNYVTSVLKIPRTLLYGCMILAYVFVILSWIVTIFAGRGKIENEKIDLGVVDESSIDAQVSEFTGNSGSVKKGGDK